MTAGVEHGQVGDRARLDLNLVEAQDLTRLDGHELDHASHAHLARVDQLGKHKRQRGLEADHAKGRKLELAGLLPRGVGSVIGDDNVDGTVDDTLTDGLGVLVGAKRRIDLERGVVGLIQVVLGQEHVVRGSLAGHLDTGGLTGSHEFQAMSGGDVLDVQLGTGQLGDLDIASDLQLLACRRPALEGQTGRDLALVDLTVTDQILVLAVAHKDLAEHLAVVHAATEHARALHATTVVSEGDGAVGDHIAHLGHGLALKTAGHGARRIDAAVADLGSAGLNELHDGAVIGDGIGVGHGAHAGEAALGSSAGATLDVLFDLVARLAQVHVHIHQTGDEILAGKVADLGSLGGEVLADLGDLVTVDQDVDDTIKLDRRIDDVGILKKQGHYRHLQAADTG